ncbi:MAG: CsgG/HfaB family protein [Deltaproteobacteria bacterium]|nr:CsgG/HfaB family protein [Deltaproteobacteria bacterium]
MMKKLLIVPALILFAFAAFTGSASAQYKKAKIAVLDFQLQGDSYETQDMGKIVSEWLITALVKDGRFDVVERRLLEKILVEQKLALTGLIDATSAAKLGRVLGVKIIISGSVMKFQNVMEVNARIIDVESASIIAAENVKSTTAARLEDLVVQMAEKIIQDFPLEGYIVNRKGNTVSVDLGKRAGVKRDMHFVVFKEGNVIKHPKTGEVLDVEMIKTGLIEIISIGNNIAKGSIIEESEKNAVKYGQRIKSVVETERPIGKYTPPQDYSIPAAPRPVVGQPDSLEEADALIEESIRLKKMKDPNWKVPFRAAASYLKGVIRTKKRSPQVNYYFARLYMVEKKYRTVSKYADLAVRYDKGYFDAYKLKGDACSEWAKTRTRGWKRIVKWGVKAYKEAAKVSSDDATKAMMYFEIGNIYSDADNRRYAMKNWKEAIAIAPESEAARRARDKMD